MPKCHECIRHNIDTNFNVEQLIAHFKFFHQLRPCDNFLCLECSHVFQSLKAFKKHFKNKETCLITDNNNTDFLIELADLNNSSSGILFDNEQSTSSSNLQSVLERIETSALFFLSNLHSKSNFSRSDVEEIISEITTKLLDKIISELESYFVANFQNEPLQCEQYSSILKFCKNPFQNFKTFYKYIKTVEGKNCYSEPKIVAINNEIGPVVTRNDVRMTENISKGMVMPLKFQFQKFFELGDNLDITLKTIKKLLTENQATSIITNIIHGEVWKSKVVSFSDKIVIPYILYYDDLEINNALGSHATEQSLAAFYYSFPTLPQHYLSSLENIFVALVYKSKDARHGNDACLNILVQEIKFLEKHGLLLQTKEGQFKVYFLLSAVVGDNLGLNSLLGFTKSFKSSYPCRICKCSQSEIVSTCKEISSKLRNRINYNEDLDIEADVAKRIKLSGLRERSIFNSIDSFHVTTNFTADIMHDVFEGVCMYDVTQVLLHLISSEKLFSLEILNSRKQSLNLGQTEVGNVSPPIKMTHLQSSKLHMSAAEIWTFCHTLPLLVGDLVPVNNEYWKLICLLIEIMDILLRVEFDAKLLKLLTQKIEQHHTHYIYLFGDTLKPKFHFLTHYPTIIKKIGPLRYIWCFRFEAKHREIKMYTNNTNSRKNIPYTVGIKCCLKFCNKVLNKIGLNDKLEFNIKHLRVKSTIREQPYYENIQNLNIFNADNLSNTRLTFIKEIKFKNTLYKEGFFLLSKSMKLYEIVHIVIENENVKDCYLICVEHKMGPKNNNFQSFKVLNKTNIFFIFSTQLHEFHYSPIHVYKSPNGNIYVRPKYY
jgi:hypothetical protein